MIQTVSFYDFCDAFEGSQYKDNFSYNGKRALFDYLEALEEDYGTPIEFDMVAICCDFTEFESVIDAAGNYFEFEGMTFDEEGTELESVEEVEEKARKFIEERTTLIEFDGGVIIQNF